jgi:hypothetical protein
MKKILLLLPLLASLLSRTALADTYSINIGATAPITESGVTWQPYNTYMAWGDYSTYSFMFGVGAFGGSMGSSALHTDTAFKGYIEAITDPVDPSVFAYEVFNPDPSVSYFLTVYGSSAAPNLLTYDSTFGTINSLVLSGSQTLGGDSYFFNKYAIQLYMDTDTTSATYGHGFIYAQYDSAMNAVQLSVPEPASLMLLGVGSAAIAAMKKRRAVTQV